jgi:glyoxylase-like metal-dependent hydrolase (beta-lactamase superfamily II)
MTLMVEMGIHRVRIPLGERFADLFLFGGPEEYVLFDSGISGTLHGAVLPALDNLAIPHSAITHVVISHLDVDHSGDIGNISSAFPQAEIVAHAADAAAMESWDDFLTQRGDEFRELWGVTEAPEAIEWMRQAFTPGAVDRRLSSPKKPLWDLGNGLEVWHVPGHTRGHLAIYSHSEHTLAISDAILGRAVPLADGTPSFPPTYRHVDQYLETIALVQVAAPRTLLTAHYGDFRGAEIDAFLDESEQFVHLLDEAILGAITAKPRNLSQIVREVNPVVATWPLKGTETALAFPVAGHLERMRENNRAVRSDGKSGWEWKA